MKPGGTFVACLVLTLSACTGGTAATGHGEPGEGETSRTGVGKSPPASVSASTPAQSADTDEPSDASAPGAISRDCPDQELIVSLRQYTTAWNEAAEPFVAQYRDPNVSAEEWLAGGATSLTTMEQAASGLRRDVATANNRQLRSLLLAISDTYQVKVLAANALVTAVENSDSDAQIASTDQLTEGGLAGRERAADLQAFLESAPQFSEDACP